MCILLGFVKFSGQSLLWITVVVHDSYSNFYYYMPRFLPNFDVSNLTVSKQPRKVEFKYANIPLIFHLHTFLILFEKFFMPNALVGCFTLLYITLKLYLYPKDYGPVVIVGLLYLLHTWVYVSYTKWHIFSCAIGTHGLPDTHIHPRPLGLYQANYLCYVTTIACIYIHTNKLKFK